MPAEDQLDQVKQMLDLAENNIRQARALLFSKEIEKKASQLKVESEGKVVEGIFDGERMVGPNNKRYDVPANYASKSKLVAGDQLKLTVLDDGTFLYKQIGPIDRKKMIGQLEELSPKNFIAQCGEKQYRVLPASITYFKAEHGDQISILVPKEGASEWAAVENLIDKKTRG